NGVFSFFSVFIVSVSVIAFFSMPALSKFLFKGFSPEMLEEVVFVSRIMLLSPVLLGFSNLLGSLTQAYNRFMVYAFAPILYNIGIIAGIVFLAEDMGAAGVALGLVAGALMHVLVQVPFVITSGLLPSLSLSIDWASI